MRLLFPMVPGRRMLLWGALCFNQALHGLSGIAAAQEPTVSKIDSSGLQQSFDREFVPLLKQLCFECHSADKQEAGVRLDHFELPLNDRQLRIIENTRKLIASSEMPPSEAKQPTGEETRKLLAWMDLAIHVTRAQDVAVDGSVRRLTNTQYRNSMRDLLGLREDITDSLPPEAVSKDGFANNSSSMVLSSLQVEAYLDIASKALDLCIVDEKVLPVIQSFRMDFGKAMNLDPCPDKLVLGANSELLNNEDFVVSEITPVKSFEFRPFTMRTNYEFIEGYQGNDTVRGWRSFRGIYHSVFACVRGTPGYPKGEAYQVVNEGLLLRPAIPSAEIFGVENTYGPKANFKISLRELPNEGDFRVRVLASKYDDGLLLEDDANPQVALLHAGPENQIVLARGPATTLEGMANIQQEGVYQVDVHATGVDSKRIFRLQIEDRHFSGRIKASKANRNAVDESRTDTPHEFAFMLIRLKPGHYPVRATFANDNSILHRLVLTRLNDEDPRTHQFKQFELRIPNLGVHVGLRRDCGSTLTQVGKSQRVNLPGIQEYFFEGAIRDYPSPEVETENVNYLAGVREIAVRSEYTDGRDMPRLLIRSIEFEGPLLTQWPPSTHARIFIETQNQSNPDKYAYEIIQQFATKAFRRHVTEEELRRLVQVWKEAYLEEADFVKSIKATLQVVLTSPQFLFLVENSHGPEPEDLSPFELASKLSYFLWNTMPDERLMNLAESGQLHARLPMEVDRMIRDERFAGFIDVFAAEWLGLDKFDIVSIDNKKYPSLTRDVKTQLRQEPARFLEHLIRENLPARSIVDSDFIMANEVVASYYDLGSSVESGFGFVPIPRGNCFGGLLSRAAILSGLSNGRQSNPVKRGAWIAKKILDEPPQDPPPNVPQIKEQDDTNQTFRQKLEVHRNQKGCIKCHLGIDPWGMPLESFDAGGLFSRIPESQTWSQLPDGTHVKDFKALQNYLANERCDQVAFSFARHLATYAIGRSLKYSELDWLRENLLQWKSDGYRTKDVIQFIIQSDLFLKK